MSALDRIRQAFPELANASDSEVLGEAARRTGLPTSQIADTLGVRPSSTTYEVGRQLGAGFAVDLPRMAGQALQYFSDAGGERVGEGAFPRLGRPTGLERQYGVQISEPAPAYRAGRALVESADARAPEWEPDMRGRGLVGEALVTGARAVGPMAPAVASMFVPGGQAVGLATQAALFGGSAAQDTYEKLLSQGVSEAEAAAAARRTGLIQGVGETAATAALGPLFRPAAAALRGATTTAGVAAAATDSAVIRPFLRGMALNVPLQAGTEVAQDVGTELVERAYGARPEDLGQIARQSALGGAGLTLLLGPLALGGSVARSRRAQQLNNALYGENVPEEARAAARLQIADMARSEGVSEADVDSWLQRQLREAEASAKYLAAEERTVAKDIQKLSEQEPLYADIAYALQDSELAKLMSDQDRQILFGAAQALRAPDLAPEAQRLVLDEANGILASYLSQEGVDGAQDLTTGKRPALFQAPRVTETPVGDLTQVSTNLPADLTAYQAPTGLGRAPTATQPVPGVPGIRQVAPGIFTAPEQLQQIETRQPDAAPTAPVVSPPSGAPAVPTPAAPVAAGGVLPAAPAAPAKGKGKKAGPVTAGQTVKVNDTEVTLSEEQAAAWNAAQEAYDGKVRRAQAITNYQERESQLRAAGMQLSAERRKITGALTAKEKAATTAEDTQLAKLLEDVDTVDTKQALPASVTGPETIKAPGKTTIGTAGLQRIRDALFKGKEARDEGENRIVTALNNFAGAYKVYLDQGGQAVSKREQLPKTKAPTDVAEAQALKIENLAENVRATLAEVGQAVNGNAKDVEAVVRLVKDMAQGKIVAPGKTKADAIKAGRQIDTMLSQAWAAAKRETFMRPEVDMADIRTGPIRAAREQAGALPPLEAASTQGVANPKGKGEAFKGLAGILQYIRNSGTPYERLLAATLRDVITGQESPIKVEFIDQGTPRFDPQTNTVYFRREESPEVVLHEAFHAALQSYVYRNANDPAVVQLKKAVKAVANFKGPLSPKAKEVQDLLKKLTADKNDLDAVLELVSYGNTFYEFRRALQEMPSQGVPASFRESARKVWQYIKNLARRLLGGKDSLASDVLESSMQLLEQAQRVQPQAGAGQVLEAAVQTNTAAPQQAQSIQAGLEQSRNELSQEAGFSNYSTYKDRPSTPMNLTRLLFEQVGFGKGGRVDKALKGAAQKSADIIRKEFPALEYVILNLNSKFGQSPTFQRLADFFKQDAQTGLLEAEYVSQYIYRNPQDAEKIIRYLDGDQTALSDSGRDATLRRMGDNILRHISEYMTTLPAKDRRLFENMKFSDYVLNPQSIAQLAGKTVGIRALREKVATESRTETSIEDFKKFLTFKDGVLDTDVPMYQFFETIPDGKGNMVRVPQGFISKDKVEQNPGMDVDRSRVWYLDKPAKEDSNAFVFKTRAVTGENLRDISSKLASGTMTPVEREQAVQQISAALVNTIAALSHNYAATNLFNGMNSIGRAEDGSVTPSSIAFDDVNQINDTFKDRKITDANVLQVSSDEARAYSIRGEAQRSGVWVRLPDTDTYGALKGKIVPGAVWNAMLDMNDRSPLLNSQALSDIMTSFKKAKTVLTPATHVNNILTNYALMLLHGIPHKALQDAARLMYRYEVSPRSLTKDQLRMMQEFYRSGAVLGQFTNTEAKKFITQRLAENIRPENDRSLLEKLGAWAGVERDTEQLLARAARAGKLTDNFFTEVYAAGDNVFRLAAFLNTAGNIQAAAGAQSLTDAQIREAGLAARKLFLDYDIDARWVRAARQSFLPFVSWAYAITPVLGRLAIEKPWTMVNMMAALGIMGSMLDGGDDEWRKKGPEQVRDMFLGVVPSYYRVPFMGDDENPVYYNLGKSIPFISLFQPAQGQAKLFGQDWFPSVLNPGGPYTSIISSVLFGTDAFTGKPLADATDTQLNKFLKGAEAVYNTMVPSIASTRLWGPEEGDIAKLLQNRKGPTGVEPDALFIARTFGLSAYEFNRSETQFWQDAQVKKLKREFETVMNKAKRDEYAKGYPDYEALDEKLADLRTRLEGRINEIRGEE